MVTQKHCTCLHRAQTSSVGCSLQSLTMGNTDLAQGSLRAGAPAAVAEGGLIGVVPGALLVQPILRTHPLKRPLRPSPLAPAPPWGQ